MKKILLALSLALISITSFGQFGAYRDTLYGRRFWSFYIFDKIGINPSAIDSAGRTAIGTFGYDVYGNFIRVPIRGTVTSVALNGFTGISVTGSPITNSGTFALSTALSGVLHGNGSGFTAGNVALGSEVSGTLPITNGGTGLTAWTIGQLVYASASNTLAGLNPGTNGYVLTSNGAGAAPTWQVAPGAGAGSGSVTSVALTSFSGITVSGSPITTSGTLSLTTTLSGVLHGSGGNFTAGNVNLTSEVTGNLPIANLASGSGANSSTFLRGDNTWAAPGSSGVTTVGAFQSSGQTNGAAIVGPTIFFGPADASNPGMVTNGAQAIYGNKSFMVALTSGAGMGGFPGAGSGKLGIGDLAGPWSTSWGYGSILTDAVTNYATGSGYYATYSKVTNSSSNVANFQVGGHFESNTLTSIGTIEGIAGVVGILNTSSGVSVTDIRGAYLGTTTSGAGTKTITQAAGAWVVGQYSGGTATIGDAFGVKLDNNTTAPGISVGNYANASITNYYGYFWSNPGGTITNKYAFYAENPGSTNWGLFLAGGKVRLGGLGGNGLGIISVDNNGDLGFTKVATIVYQNVTNGNINVNTAPTFTTLSDATYHTYRFNGLTTITTGSTFANSRLRTQIDYTDENGNAASIILANQYQTGTPDGLTAQTQATSSYGPIIFSAAPNTSIIMRRIISGTNGFTWNEQSVLEMLR